MIGPVQETKIAASYNDPRLTQKGLNPYQRYPERATWQCFEDWERADGTGYRVNFTRGRWGERYCEPYGHEWTWFAGGDPDAAAAARTLDRYNLTAEHRLTILEIEFETGPDSTIATHTCHDVPWRDVASSLRKMGLIDYNHHTGYRLTYNGRTVAAALGRRPIV